ncbi:uncharacterized protein PRCAT00004859001 [Priceomyces carsonii]|uniref:uncharacterized protein n=1 Tax=Priceomyces carsonii TaxID=28549 RepID=UPI002EDAE8EC|nr:unnamed protein product [Priceomyces carsonii]
MSQAEIRRVLKFWFGEPGSVEYLKPKSFWYGSKEDDNLVRQKLGKDYDLAEAGKLETWRQSAEGSIALILLLDQVPRNIFRDTPRAYATDDRALEIAEDVVQRGWDKEQPPTVRRYIYSPFNHSENLDIQKRSLELFTELGDPTHLYWATDFYNTIKKYGRFPHRDAILGRK